MPFKNRHPLYYVWTSMIQRCHTPTHPAYRWYGARGIRVCERWRESFDSFAQDMKERPPGMSIDRIDVNGDYEPKNCRWATEAEQQRNRWTNKLNAEQAKQVAELARARIKSQCDITKEFGISERMVRKIAGGKAWQSAQ